QARAKFHRLMATRLASDPGVQPDTIKGAAAIWITLNQNPSNRQWLPRFVEFAGGEYLADIKQDLLTRYRVYLRGITYHRGNNGPERNLSHETIRHYVRTATAVLKWAKEQGYMKVVPTPPKLAKRVPKDRDVDLNRLGEILDSLPERAGRILRFIAYTGCRPSEACRLEWRHVHLDKKLCVIDEHKTADETGEPRTIFLPDQAADILSTMAPTIGPVFTNRFNRAYKSNGLCSILRRHGGVTPYALRHTFAQTVSDGGEVPVEVLARLMGHTDTKTTGFYFKVRDRRAIQAAQTIKFSVTKSETA
ncbi:MAG: tyrosine-type recombinase/integrase, partial [Planctomycetota bacterium]